MSCRLQVGCGLISCGVSTRKIGKKHVFFLNIREEIAVSMFCVNFHIFLVLKPTGFWGAIFVGPGQEAETYAGVWSKIGTTACTILWTSKTALTALLHSKKFCVPSVVGTELDSAITHDLLERFMPLFLLTQTRYLYRLSKTHPYKQ